MREMSAQMKEMRAEMERDEQLGALMAGFRGSNLDASDFAASNVAMQLVETGGQRNGDDEPLPQVYDVDRISAYWARRPVAVITRITQLLGTGLLSCLLSPLQHACIHCLC
jgi:aarF domain-containing kinase